MRFALLLLLLLPSPALAYIGPGAALGLLGYAFGLAGLLGGAALMVVAYPVYVIWKKRKEQQPPQQ